MGFSYFKKKNRPAVAFPDLGLLLAVSKSRWIAFRHLLFICRSAAVICLVFALARPQAGRGEVKRTTEGLDIMLVIDTSGSMRALDFEINGKRLDRLDVIKTVMRDFIEKRPDDRIGMVVFGTNAFAQAPLTLDHDVLLRFLEGIQIGMAGDGTAIGDAIGVASNRLKDLAAKSKIAILLTDGKNTAGKIDPREVAKAAKAVGVKVYTIGAGSNGLVPMPTEAGIVQVKTELDEALLKDIADTTGGQYFRATDTEKLVEIYSTIDKLEKTKVETPTFQIHDEKYAVFVWPGLIMMILELFLGLTRLRRLP
jgi:Ca-activated chloride channel family protein